ncbi:sigma-70 family RNA polymerase sigma factor [bacterium]|nr:MAG: sigma-70 family RNA polymerase sigma factor [bacterium]
MELAIGAKGLRLGRRLDVGAEEALLERCRRQDVEAFGRFIDLYQARVLGYVRRMVPTTEEAEDVTQETFVRAFQSFDRFDGRANVRTWLFRIAHNLCIDRARRADRRVTESSLTEGEEGDEYDVADSRWQPETFVMNAELAEVVEDGIRGMSEKLRSVLLLHDREDMAYDEIAQTLGLPVGTVKSRLFLARNHLQKVLRPYLDGREEA